MVVCRKLVPWKGSEPVQNQVHLLTLNKEKQSERETALAAPEAGQQGESAPHAGAVPPLLAGVSTPPLPGALPGCGNVAARRFVSGSSPRTERLKTLPQAGQGKEEAVCSARRVGRAPPPPCQCGAGEGKEAERQDGTPASPNQTTGKESPTGVKPLPFSSPFLSSSSLSLPISLRLAEFLPPGASLPPFYLTNSLFGGFQRVGISLPASAVVCPASPRGSACDRAVQTRSGLHSPSAASVTLLAPWQLPPRCHHSLPQC
ncbi:hypothetical protein FQA47_014290 [Oryzias melastigma]|uniref:Uncharacterized protein n=1 Tax=Oryzias melastigma TaxID=30732 RepID=A0A834FJH4_ORYME|nr:hypothetical protein FQA47_014290 [Oryzias melastigma]